MALRGPFPLYNCTLLALQTLEEPRSPAWAKQQGWLEPPSTESPAGLNYGFTRRFADKLQTQERYMCAEIHQLLG